MNKTNFKKEFKKTLDTIYSIMEKKNADYTKTDPFGNFNLVKELGITTVEKGILVRMADKMSRISNLIDQEAQVKDEAIEDTLQDLANYAVILKIYLSTINICKHHDDNYKIGVDIGAPEGDKSIAFTLTNAGKVKEYNEINIDIAVEYIGFFDENTIYHKIIKTAIQEIKSKGYITFIHKNNVKQKCYDINDFISLLINHDRSN